MTECAPSSVSSDSGLSTTSLCIGAAGTGLQSQVQKAMLESSMDEEQPHVQVLSSKISIRSDGDGKERENLYRIDPAFHINGQTTGVQQKNSILDNENKSTFTAVVSDSKETGLTHSVLSRCEYSAKSEEDGGNGVRLEDTRTHTSSTSDQTHIWVKQQQLVSAGSYMYGMSDRLETKVQSGIKNDFPEAEADKDGEFASLALDIDQSIEQLNQLILDLDPEFEPVPTLARGHMTCSTINGVGYVAGQARSSQSGKIYSVTNKYIKI